MKNYEEPKFVIVEGNDDILLSSTDSVVDDFYDDDWREGGAIWNP